MRRRPLAAMKRRVERDDARLLVVCIPAQIEVNGDDWERTKARYGIGDRRLGPGLVAARLEPITAELKVPFLDLTAALKQASGLGRGTYFRTDSHWNARGASAGARAVASKLRSLGWVPACSLGR